ncbi:MAG: class I SAM-dependent methyltransferase [Candidatus Acidiferrales bacterium]
MIPSPALIPTKRTYAGVFFITLATLMFEVLLTRIFSVTMWYHFAFVAISVAMFGLSVGATLVYVFPHYFTPERAKEHMARFAQFFAFAAITSFFAHASVPFIPEQTFAGIASIVFTYTVIAIPFVLSGICVCLALTRFPQHISRIYAADLIGAALGCVLLLYALDVTDAGGAVLLVSFLASLGAFCFGSETQSRRLRSAWKDCVFFFILVCVQTGFAWSGRPLLRLTWSKGDQGEAPLYEKWNSFSRVRVFGDSETPAEPFGWGLSANYVSKPSVRQLSLDIDSNAYTVMTHFDGDFKPLDYLQYDVTNMVYHIRPNGSVLVVGAGGGRDVLSALSFGEKSVLAVELNPNILKMLNGRYSAFTGHLDRVPGVRFVNDEARSYVARSTEHFDVIQISMIDTWAATTAGAFVFSENSLYTLEAWRSFLDHLTRQGILSVSRWSFQEESGEVYRATSLAGAALRQRGIQDVRNHLVIIRRNGPRGINGMLLGIATILISRQPFASDDLNKLEEVSHRMGFDIMLSPRFTADPTLAALAAGDIPQQSSANMPLNLAPPTDNQPFFFFTMRPTDLWNPKLWKSPVLTFNLKAMFVLAVLAVTVIVFTVLCILLPLFFAGQRTAMRGAFPLLAFFAAIGAGVILIELSQMQRLMIFLGHPSYALSVVLFVLLISSGLGSFFTERLTRNAGNGNAIVPRLMPLLVVLSLFGPLTPYALAHFSAATTPIRILVAGAILFPLGFFMGMPFPLGMKLASSKSPALMPWLWGVNGATSVCASVVSAIIAVVAGISAAYWTGVVCYFIAIVAISVVKLRTPQRAENALVA